MAEYTSAELIAIYELGRLYYETGYLTAAERIFSGLAAVDGGQTPARIGLGLIRLERGDFDQALSQFRSGAKRSAFGLSSKLGVVLCLLSRQAFGDAHTMLKEMEPEVNAASTDRELQQFWRALSVRCS